MKKSDKMWNRVSTFSPFQFQGNLVDIIDFAVGTRPPLLPRTTSNSPIWPVGDTRLGGGSDDEEINVK